MLDIRFVRENPDAVKENIRKKFQDDKLPLVDEVLDLDAKLRAAIQEADELRSNRKKLSKQVGALMGQAKKDPSKAAEAEAVKAQVAAQADRLKELEATFPGYPIHMDPLSLSVACHIGPGAQAVTVSKALELK